MGTPYLTGPPFSDPDIVGKPKTEAPHPEKNQDEEPPFAVNSTKYLFKFWQVVIIIVNSISLCVNTHF